MHEKNRIPPKRPCLTLLAHAGTHAGGRDTERRRHHSRWESLGTGRRKRKVGRARRWEGQTTRRGEWQTARGGTAADRGHTGHAGERRRDAHVAAGGTGRTSWDSGRSAGHAEGKRRAAGHTGEWRRRHAAGKVERRVHAAGGREWGVEARADAAGSVLRQHGIVVGLAFGGVGRGD